MRHLVCAVLIGGLAASPIFVSALRAEDQASGAKEAGEHHDRAPGKMKEKLGLSDDQAAKLEAAVKAKREAVKPLHEQLKQGMEKLRDQIKGKAADGDVQATLAQLDQTRKALQAENEKFMASTASFLTATQRGKMLLWHMKRMRHGEWKEHKEHREKEGPGDDEGAGESQE